MVYSKSSQTEPQIFRLPDSQVQLGLYRETRRMKKSSTGGTNSEIMNEPLIVVEESGGIAEEEEEEEESKPSSADESPSNQYLLTPWRDMRKSSLPTPPCTSGITASQVCQTSHLKKKFIKLFFHHSRQTSSRKPFTLVLAFL